MDNSELVNLLARCALREQQALEQLYKRTAAYLNAIAYRIVGSSEGSNEVLQEAFIQIWDNASNYAPSQANAIVWMSSIVRYRAIDKLKIEQRHQRRPAEEEEKDILMNTPGNDAPDEHHRQLQLTQTVKSCLDAMNDKFKHSVELAYLYGYSREELAEALDANVNTVKSWLRRGSSRLKECLEKHRLNGTNLDSEYIEYE